MKLTRLFSAIFCTAVVAAATPTAGTADLPIFKRHNHPAVPNSFIVLLKDKTDQEAHIAELSSWGKGTHRIKYNYSAFNGYNGFFDEACLDKLRNDPAVALIEPDYLVNITYSVSPFQTPTPPAPHRRQEAPHRRQAPPHRRRGACTAQRKASNGYGVDIYTLDTGIYIDHEDFGGRAVHGPVFGVFGSFNSSNDDNGHGTHIASLAAGTKYGIAKGASLIGIKVLKHDGSGVTSDIIKGIDWVIKQAGVSGRSSIINLSAGGTQSDALDSAVRSAIDAGVHFVAAAGNNATDAREESPAREQSIVTVGAVDSRNKMAPFSNFGPVLDVFALGVNVQGAYIGSPQATKFLSGTSMATPVVAGTLAVELSKFGKTSPAVLQNRLKQNAKPVVTGQPDGTTYASIGSVITVIMLTEYPQKPPGLNVVAPCQFGVTVGMEHIMEGLG